MKDISKKDLKKIEKKSEKLQKKGQDSLIISFHPTRKVGKFIQFDDENQLWMAPKNAILQKGAGIVFRYSDIVEVALIEDGRVTVSKTSGGLGRAVVGGALFGIGGALVGASTSSRTSVSRESCKREVRVTVNDNQNPMVPIPVAKMKTAQEILSALMLVKQNSQQNSKEIQDTTDNFSTADELLKLKGLLDSGILTQEEFETQKQKLLSK